jgi:pyruvate dehydrogenase E2 component (dihydrolipoamide acetyltransferase)
VQRWWACKMTKIIPITLPKWGLEMSEGTVTVWHLSEGEEAEAGADLVDVETDKIVNSVELETAGTLRQIVVQAGEVAPVGALIAVLADPAVSKDEIDTFIDSFRPVDASFDPSDAARLEDQIQAAEGADPLSDTKATPLAVRVARQLGVDVAAIKGTGSKGKVTKGDVELAGRPPKSDDEIRIENDAVSASPIARKFANQVGISLLGLSGSGRKGRVSLADAELAAETAGLWSAPSVTKRQVKPPVRMGPTIKPFTGMRKSIAKAMVAAKDSVPHFYTSSDIRIDSLMELRRMVNASGSGTKVSVNDFLIRAVGLSLQDHPGVNIHVSDEAVTYFETANISVAVSIDDGLLTPVVRNAGRISLQDIAATSADLAARCRTREILPSELKDGTFTISNLGMFGVRTFDAIINAPQGAILSVGGPRRLAVENPLGGVGFATEISVTLSADHRAIDGVLAAKFLATLRGYVEDPHELID